jgi:hypothetical protein
MNFIIKIPKDVKISLLDALVQAKICKSKREARDLWRQGSIKQFINNEWVKLGI